MSHDSDVDANHGESSHDTKFVETEDMDDGFAYDPDQDPNIKRRVRRDYRDLNKVTEGNLNPNDFTTEQLVDKVKRANSLFGHVKGPQEATLDSAFLLMASNMGAMKARAMKSGPSAFDADDFVSKLLSFMGGSRQVLRETREVEDGNEDEFEDNGDDGTPLQWDRVGRKALAKSRRIPVIDFMLGPLSIEAKKRAQTKRARLEKDERDKAKPQEILEEDITRSENETTANVAQLERLLVDQDGKINLFRFIINPDDFGQTVENLFYLSFLIRDGKCALEIEENGEPMIYACEQPDESDYSEGVRKQQIVMEIDMATWQHAIEVFNITKSIIPQRVVKGTRIGAKWYG